MEPPMTAAFRLMETDQVDYLAEVIAEQVKKDDARAKSVTNGSLRRAAMLDAQRGQAILLFAQADLERRKAETAAKEAPETDGAAGDAPTEDPAAE